MALSARRGRLVLAGFAEALAGIETVWSLLEFGADVVVFTRRGRGPALRRCRDLRVVEITAPEDDAALSMADLAEAVERLAPSALMALDDVGVWLTARVAGGAGVALVGPDGDRERLALDKRLQLDAAQAAGLAVPSTHCLDTASDALDEELDFPLVIKPAVAVVELEGALVRGRSFICGDARELEAAVAAFTPGQPALVQPLLRGTGEGLFGFSRPDGVVAWSAHRRIRMMNPEGSGASACAIVPVDPGLAEAGGRMMRAADWRGMFMLEFLRDGRGIPWFMELNGRPWGSMALTRRAGMEYPAWALAQSLGDDGAPDPAPSAQPVACRHLGRELIHLAAVLRGPSSRAVQDWPSRWRTAWDVLSPSPGFRLYNWRRGDSAVFVDDTAQTVLGPIRDRLRRRR